MTLPALAGGVAGASLAWQDNSRDDYFLESDPAYKAYKTYIEEFSSE